jgi:hypothetical protein
MSNVAAVGGSLDDQRLFFRCPGCGEIHGPQIRGPNEWKWNGNLEKPTLMPSIKVTWNDANGEHVCHSFVNDGRIAFLTDCTHALAGKTADLAPFDW